MQVMDGFAPSVRRQIRDSVGACCSAPYCGRQTHGWNPQERKAIYKGDAAHVFGARPLAPRHDELPPDMDRHGFENGIWLCTDCHRMVDQSPAMYPAQVLLAWKDGAEARHNLGYHRAFDRPHGVNLHEELDKAYAFLEQLKPAYLDFMEAIAARPPFTTLYPISNEAICTLRQLARHTIGTPRWSNRHPNWTFVFHHWQDELVRLADLLCDYPQFRSLSNRLVDWARTVERRSVDDTAELKFHSPVAADIYLFKQQYERFSDYVVNFKG